VELQLGAASAGDAVAAGRAMADRGEGYRFGDYLLFSVDDALHVSDDGPTIEAIVLGTPYERLRYQAYLLEHQQLPFPAAAIDAFDAAHLGRLDVVIFAHSHTPDDRTFMQGYGAAVLDGPGNVHLQPAAAERTEPVRDVYYQPDGTFVMRWLGQITFRFDLARAGVAASPLRFSFRDDRDRLHEIAIVPARYR
jgi:hypothetical protein